MATHSSMLAGESHRAIVHRVTKTRILLKQHSMCVLTGP